MKFGELRFRAGLAAVLFAALVWGFRQMIFVSLPFIFSDHYEDMSYGWYVPVFSAYVLWVERRKILRSLGAPALGGLLLALPFLCIGFIGVRGSQVRFSVLAFTGLCLAIPWAVFGRETAKRVLFPVLFLLFCIPLSNFLDVITIHLRLLASSTAYGILKGVGADVVRQGTMLMSGSGAFSIDIAEPCSGLRSIFALMALTAGYAYFNQPTWLRRGILFAMSVPLAVFGNVMRILTICLVGTYASGDFATGFYHDYSGYVVFIVAIALMVACGEALNRVFPKPPPKEEEKACPPVAQSVKWRCAVPFLLAALVVPVMVVQSNVPECVLCELPEVRLPELEGFTSEELQPSEAELTVLPKDTRFMKRLYTAENGQQFQVSVVLGGRNRNSIHRPELCLPAQGFLMTKPRTIDVDGVSWRAITLDGGVERPSAGLAYTFFNQDGFRTSSHVRRIFRDVWDRSLYGRIDRWVMVTVNTSWHDDVSLRALLSKLKGVVK